TKVGAELGREYDIVIGGRLVKTEEKIKSLNPARPSQVVGIFQSAGREHVEPAIQAAARAFESWKRTSMEERAGLLYAVAGLLRERKLECAAWMVYEVAKNWAEADADIAETIDFAEFYSREALRLAQAKTPVQLPGEGDRLMYIPLGVGAVIPPWNFPCAIMAGVTTAPGLCGHTGVVEAFPRFARHRRQVLRGLAGSEDAGWSRELLSRLRLELWRRSGGTSPDTLHRFYRIERSWPRHQPTRRGAAPGPKVDQAHGPGDGRQGFDRRRCGRQPRRRGRRRGPVCIWLSGSEMLGLLARHHRPKDL